VSNPFAGVLPANAGLLAAPTVTQGQLLRPYPQFRSLTAQAPTLGDSIYHSLQTRLEKRFRSGGILLASYTWSKFISTTDTLTSWLEGTGVGGIQNNNNLRGERSLTSFDVPHRAVVSYVLDLPIGKGKRLLANASGLENKLVSGWGINGITTFQSGFPLPFTSAQASVFSSTFGGGGSRPNVIAGCDKSVSGSAQSRLTHWFNTACFSQPPQFGFGNESRTDPNLRSSGINTWDVSLFKSTPITERVALQFRAEFFNLFNRVQFGSPGTALGTAQFGLVTSQLNQPRLIQFALRLQF
jgi:hypothetical protein